MSKNLKEEKKQFIWLSGGSDFQAEGTARANALWEVRLAHGNNCKEIGVAGKEGGDSDRH